MPSCFFASDLHGRVDRYRKLFDQIRTERPAALLLGGDLLPSGLTPAHASDSSHPDFVGDFLARELEALRSDLGGHYPRVFVILGNDDARIEEEAVLEVERRALWEYAHNRRIEWGGFVVYGYAIVPPTPFLLKDWERYDVSRFVDPGSVSPEEGHRSVPVPEGETRWGTIAADLEALAGDDDVSGAVFLFHSPPHRTALDRGALDGKTVDHAPVDVHLGSIAVRRFIEARQPLVTLHGHVHESARLTGSWRDRIGRTACLSAAHDGPELALVRLDLERPEAATRELL
jgi:Icc-related predicted phosphoesterase